MPMITYSEMIKIVSPYLQRVIRDSFKERYNKLPQEEKDKMDDMWKAIYKEHSDEQRS